MTWTSSLAPSSASAAPIRRFSWSDSTTHGPAMRNGAAPAAKCCATSVASAGELGRPLGLGEGRSTPGAMVLERRVGLGDAQAGPQLAGIRSQPHRPPQLLDPFLGPQQRDHRVLALGGELARVGVRELDHVARELDDRRLQAETDPEKGQLVLP